MEFWRVLAKLFVGTENLKKDYENLEERKKDIGVSWQKV